MPGPLPAESGRDCASVDHVRDGLTGHASAAVTDGNAVADDLMADATVPVDPHKERALRSPGRGEDLYPLGHGPDGAYVIIGPVLHHGVIHLAGLLPVDGDLNAAVLEVEFPDIDRKSTRLNSSHANISYAVFCLKK